MKCNLITKVSTIFLVLVCHSSIVVAASDDSNPASPPTPRLVVDTISQNFGRVKQGQVISRTFKLTNQGTAPLKIKNIEIQARGLTIKAKNNIAAGESMEAILTLDTSRFYQQTKAQLELSTNDPFNSHVTLSLEGTVFAPIDILPLPAIYLSRFTGEETTRTLTIQNNQDSELLINRLESKGTHFTAELETIESGKLFRLHVNAPQSTPPGRYREALVVHTNDPNHRRIHLEMNILVKPDIFLTQEKVDFGQVSTIRLQHNPSILKLIEQTLLIKRKSGNMILSTITSDIPFLDIKAEPESQAQNFSLKVGLDPDKLMPGSFSGTITIKTDDPDHPQILLPVNGEITK